MKVFRRLLLTYRNNCVSAIAIGGRRIIASGRTATGLAFPALGSLILAGHRRRSIKVLSATRQSGQSCRPRARGGVLVDVGRAAPWLAGSCPSC
jgi:hypothetical protein